MINEHKKNRRAVKYNIKPRNFVAKNATTSGAGEHKDKSKELPRKAKHKSKEMDMAESLLKENIMGAPRPEDNHEASMALSELYRNAKYAMALLKIIEPNDAIDGWVQANLTSAADMLDKVGHYLDYKNINGRKPEVDMDEDDNVDDADVGEADGSMARENLQIIIEYSIRLMEMIKPGDNLASWVSMKLTKASEAVSSAKHFIEYRNFEKHASDAFESKLTRMLVQQLVERMAPASTFVGSKKNKLGSAGQLKGNMKRPARAGDLVGGDAEESVEPPKHYGGQGPEGAKFDLYMQQRKNANAALKPPTKESGRPDMDEQVSVDAHPTDSGDWTYSINGKPVKPGSDTHNSIKDQHMDQVSPIYKPLKQMMSQPPSQSMGADPYKDSENDVQPNDVIIPSHPKGEWVKIRDIGETDQKPKTTAKTWDEMSSKEKLSGVKGRTVWNPKTQKYRTVFDVPTENKK
jgi:hypothetical protein